MGGGGVTKSTARKWWLANRTVACLEEPAKMGLARSRGCAVRYSRKTRFDPITATEDRLEAHHWQVASALLDGLTCEELP